MKNLPLQIIKVGAFKNQGIIHCYELINGSYKQIMAPMKAYVGKKGVARTKIEGDMKTPMGVFRLGYVFGFCDWKGHTMKYRKIKTHSKWCCNGENTLYNRWSHGEIGSCENLWEYAREYYLAVVIKYNYTKPIKGKGSAIFLHVSDKPTSGCVGISALNMRRLLSWLREDKNPHIYIYSV